MAAALYGTVLGSLIGGWPADRFGRKPTLLWIGVLYIVSAVGSALAWNVEAFIVARFIGGIGIGVSTVVAPLYIAEIAPPAHRGRLAGMFQFNIVFGIVVAFLSNALLAGIGANAWRWMLGVAAFPSIVYTLMCLAIPESPRWLLTRKGDRDGGLRVLRLIEPDRIRQRRSRRRRMVSSPPPRNRRARRGFWSMRLRVPIMLAFLVAFFNQLSGINAILYFAPRIFEMTGLGAKAALLQSVGIGITNLDLHVRRPLADRPPWPAHAAHDRLVRLHRIARPVRLGVFHPALLQSCPRRIFAFIAAHAVGQGTVIWVLISEIFPNQYRATGQSLGSATHWIFAALLTTFFPRDGDRLRARLHLPLLLRDDGAPTDLGENDGAGNQGRAARGDPADSSAWRYERASRNCGDR